tara:strand:+ start:53 stop:298 length:246 start_codon:yes stop_codon:yes gene_type:complete
MERDENKKVQDNMNYRSEKDEMQKENSMQASAIPKGLTMKDAIQTFKMSLDRDPKNIQEVIDFFKNRRLNKKLPEKSEIVV